MDDLDEAGSDVGPLVLVDREEATCATQLAMHALDYARTALRVYRGATCQFAQLA